MRPTTASLVDLRTLRGSDLQPVLEAQALHWQEHFAWDCRQGMLATRRLLDRRLLMGRALACEGRPVGYAYFVPEGPRATVGDLFVTDGVGSLWSHKLLESTLNAACLHRGVRRVEGQLLCLDWLPIARPAIRGVLRTYRRALMLKSGLGGLPAEAPAIDAVRYLPWSDGFLQDASALVVTSYRGHVDSRINDQYSSLAGARRGLEQSTRQLRSGRFFPPAGIVVRQSGSSALIGLCLGSLVSDAVGHVSQLCVSPSSCGRGLGSELLRRAVRAFAGAGCEAVSLTVTASNSGAIRLYERHGFRTIASFPAFVWQKI